jgi:hypothetical protein
VVGARAGPRAHALPSLAPPSQTKETLTLRASSFGSSCVLPDKFLKAVADAGVAERVLSFATSKSQRALKAGDGAKRARIAGLPKLMDANDAGGKHSEHCTLILTEGDSAKSLVVGGLSVAGRDRYGVFPLRGKLLNVRDASPAAVAGNAEISHIKQILGLQHGKVYESAKALRYGHLMIMTDQDHDGSHIKVRGGGGGGGRGGARARAAAPTMPPSLPSPGPDPQLFPPLLPLPAQSARLPARVCHSNREGDQGHQERFLLHPARV